MRASGIVCSVALQPGLLIAIYTVNCTYPLWTAPAFQSTTHIKIWDTLCHSSIYLLGHFATIAIPPKGSKRVALKAPGPKVKWNKPDRGSLPNHYTVDNWKGFLSRRSWRLYWLWRWAGLKRARWGLSWWLANAYNLLDPRWLEARHYVLNYACIVQGQRFDFSKYESLPNYGYPAILILAHHGPLELD